jgi:hypothetical protein
VKGTNKRPFAVAGYRVYNGNGKVKGVVSTNFNGYIDSKKPFSGTYTVKADCTGTLTLQGGVPQNDLFIAPDGSMFTFVQTDPPGAVTSGFELRGTAQRVGDRTRHLIAQTSENSCSTHLAE